eukprot:CAMPEP_0117750184 /NCGR_PEP_ID=MMETSP0947-20121206/10201_1 /TAXON_ID=44440 /ORGANISM="Chattonella subsalsa, Strain CCMP2191" /LENGTH=473 /DNA_ID=CAMNT_0005568271 /DNA_START=112 /DNA_END=1534 /DNA_ORIENTATION=+
MKSVKRNAHHQKNFGLKALGPGVLPSEINRKRYYKPKVTTEINPHCTDRQLDDQYHLMQLNRNPRVNQLTKAELSRSEKFLITKKDPPNKILDRKKANILSKSLGVSLQEGWEAVDRLSSRCLGKPCGGWDPHWVEPRAVKAWDEGAVNWYEDYEAGAGLTGDQRGLLKTSASQGLLQTGQSSRRRAKPKRREKKDPNTMPELIPYRMTVTDAEPPTYGHRPKSASRMMNPMTLGVNVSTAKPSSPSRKPKAGMSSELLRELLASPDPVSEEVHNPTESGTFEFGDTFHTSTYDPLDWENSKGMSGGRGRDQTRATPHSYSLVHSSAEGQVALNSAIQSTLQDSLSRLEFQNDWDNSLTLPSKKGKKTTSLILEGSIPVRTEDKLQRYRKKAAGIEFHPFCSDRQNNDFETMRTREGIKRPILKEPAPLTPRKMKQANEIRRLLNKEKKRQQKLRNIEAKHDLIEEWSRIPQH